MLGVPREIVELINKDIQIRRKKFQISRETSRDNFRWDIPVRGEYN